VDAYQILHKNPDGSYSAIRQADGRKQAKEGMRLLFEPHMKRTEFDAVLDRRIPRQDANREILADVFDPTALPDGSQPERDGFIEAFGGDFCRVLDSFGIADGDAAGADRHTYGCYVIKGHTVMAADSCAAAGRRSVGRSEADRSRQSETLKLAAATLPP
jgi:hypothetical protein